MPRPIPSLIREGTDLTTLVALSNQESLRELRWILRAAEPAEIPGESRPHGRVRVWAVRVAAALVVAGVIAIYALLVLRLQIPMSGDPFP